VSQSSPGSSPPKARSRAALALLASVVLVAVAVAILVRLANVEKGSRGDDGSNKAGTLGTVSESGAEGNAQTAALSKIATQLDIEIPAGDPSAVDPWAPRPLERFPGKFSRWNLENVPGAWDDAVAERLHGYFDDLHFEQMDSGEVQVRVQRARENLRKYLASLGPEALPTLAKILDVEPDFIARRDLMDAIGGLGRRSDAATWILRDYYVARRSDPVNRSEIGHLIRAMGHLGSDTAYEQLRFFAEDASDGEYRDKFIVELGNHPRRDEAVDVFERTLGDESFGARNKAAQALGKVANEATLPALMDAFDHEPMVPAKQTILGSLGKIGSPEAIPFLEAQARGAAESDVRLSAANALRRIVEKTGNEYARGLLDQLVRTESSPEVRRYIETWVDELSAAPTDS
jgi:HEAT repeat protein